VVLWRAYLRYHDLPAKGLHWSLPPANMRRQISSPCYLDCDHLVQCLLYLLPPFDDLPMPSNILLLDAIWCTSGTARHMYFTNYYCGLDLYPWGAERTRGLDFGHDAHFSCVELANEYSNQSVGCSYPGAWCCVRSPPSIKT
jgi:hypothetical protein